MNLLKSRWINGNIKRFLNKNFGKENAKKLYATVRPSMMFVPDEQAQVIEFDSKIGGFPDLTERLTWSEYQGRKLNFILQLNCSKLKKVLSYMPNEGMLYFFLDLHNKRIFPREKGQFAVLYSKESEVTKVEVSFSTEVETKLIAKPSRTIPSPFSPMLPKLELAENEWDLLSDLHLGRLSEICGTSLGYGMGEYVDDNVIDEWIESLPAEKGVGIKPEMFVKLISFGLTEWGYDDGDIYFGILNNDLKRLSFDHSVVAFEVS